MTSSLFFRLLKTPIDEKGDALRQLVQHANPLGPVVEMPPCLPAGREVRSDVFALDPADFAQIPGSPFAYWVTESIRRLFTELPKMQSEGRRVCFGLSTKDDFQFLRLSWEVSPQNLSRRWFPFVKGGAYSPYYYDVHLVLDWENDGERLKAFANKRTQEIFGAASWSRWINNWDYYFRPGLTWPRRTNGLSFRILPSGCIFADKGPVILVAEDNPDTLLLLLAIVNSMPFEMLIRVQLARTELAQSYEVGLVQQTPIPPLTHHASRITSLAREAHGLARDLDRADETTHVFCLPGLARRRDTSLLQSSLALQAEQEAVHARLRAIQAEIDDIAFDLYGLNESDRALVRAEMGDGHTNTEATEEKTDESLSSPCLSGLDESDEEPPAPDDLPARVANLLMWCVGVVYGRWDARYALDPAQLPELPGPFDPLPRYVPGALLPSPSQGEGPPCLPTGRGMEVLVDDPTHPDDIVTRVRHVLATLWGDRADEIEQEACQILGFETLRDYFRDPRQGFFAFHIKRYSKSRRKAPIYWLLQSAKRNYAIWLYYHRLTPDTLFLAAREYADAKVKLEESRLEELRATLESLSGGARKAREREIARQASLVAEVIEFRKKLDAAALLELRPDLNDGVLLTMAPLREITPWKEPGRVWDELALGQYAWSSISQQLKKKRGDADKHG